MSGSILSAADTNPPGMPGFSLIASDMEAIDLVIRQRLYSDIKLIGQVTEYIVKAGGKRIRPTLVLLLAGALGYKGNDHHVLAAVVETIHTATLLHDDVVDESMLRRGLPSANIQFGNAASVLVGDFLYTRAFQMMVSMNDLRILQTLSSTTNIIAEGEVMQLMNMRNPDISEENYLNVIESKTAKLFEASALLGALVARTSDEVVEMAAEYGRLIGMAFQLIDDMLDYAGDITALGKTIGDDLREGKMTLPLIYFMQNSSNEQREMIRDCIKNNNTEHFDQIIAAVVKSDALEYTFNKARQMAETAASTIAILPESAYKSALLELSAFAVNRKY